jgi:hypothetical protein
MQKMHAPPQIMLLWHMNAILPFVQSYFLIPCWQCNHHKELKKISIEKHAQEVPTGRENTKKLGTNF